MPWYNCHAPILRAPVTAARDGRKAKTNPGEDSGERRTVSDGEAEQQALVPSRLGCLLKEQRGNGEREKEGRAAATGD